MTNFLATVQQNEIKLQEYWDKLMLGMIKLEKENFVFTNLGIEKEIPKNSGTTTVSFRRYLSLGVSAGLTKEKLAEAVAPTPLRVEAQKVQGTVNQYGAYIEETDWVDEIHMDDIESIYMPELSRHAAEVIEREILSSFSDASEYFVNSKTSVDGFTEVSGNVLTLKEMRKVALIMRNQRRSGHSKFGGKPVFVVHPNVIEDLLDDADLLNRILTPGNDNSPIKNGSLQQYKMYGFYVIESLIMPVASNTSSVNVYTSIMLGREPYAVIKLGSNRVRFYQTGFKAEKTDPLAQKATFGYKLWTGSKVLDPMTIFKVYSTSAYDDALTDLTNDVFARYATQLDLDDATIALVASLGQTAQNEEDTLTATVTDGDSESVTELDDAYYIAWSSSDTAVCTVTSSGAFTAVVKAMKASSGTATITASLMKRTADTHTVISTDTLAYTLTIG